MPSPALDRLPVRRLTVADHSRCADLSESRGWTREEHKWRLLLTAGTGYGIDAPGHAGLLAACVLTVYGPGPASGPGLGAVGMMLVAEEYERQGVGRRLLRHLMDGVAPLPLTLYATPQGRGLYEKLGFKVIGQSETVRGRFVPDTDTVGTAATARPSVVTRPAVADDLPTVLRLDGEVFGADRTQVIARLPAFSDVFLVAETDGRITGCAALWPHGTTHVIGPLVAADAATAVALVSALATRSDRILRTDVDVRHTELLTWLKAHGLATTAVNAVMAHGTGELPGDPARNFAPLTVATG
jgi:GNAT superfamily N-acetyltransferase